MQDPFADQSNSKLHREVQLWMAGLACLLVVFLYLSVKRMTGTGEDIPAHILQSGVAQITPPLEPGPNPAQLSKPSQLTNAPAIPIERFIPTAKPLPPRFSQSLNQPPSQAGLNFPNHRQPLETFSKVDPKTVQQVNVPQSSGKNQLDRDERLVFPQPALALPVRDEATKSDVENAESLGRQRARQLAAITSGLPKRLNQIQSSIKRASAELPAEKSLEIENSQPSNNGFVPAIPSKSESSKLGHPIAEIPAPPFSAQPFSAQPVALKPFAVTPEVATPRIESSKPIKSLRTRNPKSRSAEIQPAKIPPATNAFQPLPSAAVVSPVKPLPTAEPSSVQDRQQGSAPAVSPLSTMRKLESLRPSLRNQADETTDQKHSVSSSKQYVVESGDSFFTIAQQQYGDGQWFRALRLANQKLIIEREGLQPGMSLSIPTSEELAREFPDQAPKTVAQQPSKAEQRIYTTQAGDTLFDIARRKTGQGSRFSEIIRANKLFLPAGIRASDQLPADLRLVLPESTLQ